MSTVERVCTPIIFQKKILLVLLGILTSTGCAHVSLVRQDQSVVPKLSINDSFYIAVNMDGVYGDEKYEGSGLALSQVILESFAKRVQRVEIGRTYQTYDEALKFSRANGWKYFVFPTILHWERHATEWNMIPNKIKVRIQIIDVETGKFIDSIIISGTSSAISMGGAQPQDLLPSPVEKYISGLFGYAEEAN